MTGTIEFLIRHGYSLLFAWVLAEQLGLPTPSAPMLLGAGALAGRGLMRFPVVIGLVLLAVSLCDTLWYVLGRLRGAAVLRFICKITLEPDSCVRRTQLSFERRGPWALVAGKFMPGLSAMLAPLAGVSRMSWRRFVLFDTIGALLWCGSYVAVGFVFSSKLERVMASLSFLGGGFVVLLLAGLSGYIAWKWQNRRRFLKKLPIQKTFRSPSSSRN